LTYLPGDIGARWQALADKGAQTQRLYGAGSTKNPNYSDVLYVEELIGSDTVNTIPPATFEAFRDRGRPRASLQEHLEEAHDTGNTPAGQHLNAGCATDKLAEGVQLFIDAFDKQCRGEKREAVLDIDLNRLTYHLPSDLNASVWASLKDW